MTGREVATNFKTKRYKNKKYKDWVSSLDCVSCNLVGPSEPHHIKGVGYMSGVGLKAPDSALMPLCRRCHLHVHNNSGEHKDQWMFIAKTLMSVLEGGLKF